MFLIYGILNVTNCVFVALCMRETKGVPLEEIPALFGPVNVARSKDKMVELEEASDAHPTSVGHHCGQATVEESVVRIDV